MANKFKGMPLYHPRLWPTWGGVFLLRLFALLPYGLILRLGPWLGRLYARVLPKRRLIAKTNIDLCFPDKSPEWREQLLRDSFDSLGITLLEAPLAWWAPTRRMSRLAHIQGLENLRQALARGKGVLLLSAHLNSPEFGGRLLVHEQPFAAMYRPSNNPVIDRMISKARLKWLPAIIPRHNARGAVRALKQGQAVWYAVDQNAGRRESVFADFFGIPASTNPATARLARLSGAVVVPFRAVRRKDGKGHDLYLEAPWENFPSGDLVADTQRVNDLVERWVRETPEQYMWIHRRFRTRPQRSDPRIYPVD
ncbi:MAG TPA: LpxL/LpxP family Kdo(2)-lipid IV(A) lauroyl/palmitoleoyl acyltransferase [Gammaproteobacteria bacterium]|nr:LpxL/LpxP family Kdo(2)-lipid IV(A) lauroyl/palmitoleoyl acyltransferase [Gammaproteobacteria bacterium]